MAAVLHPAPALGPGAGLPGPRAGAAPGRGRGVAAVRRESAAARQGPARHRRHRGRAARRAVRGGHDPRQRGEISPGHGAEGSGVSCVYWENI